MFRSYEGIEEKCHDCGRHTTDIAICDDCDAHVCGNCINSDEQCTACGLGACSVCKQSAPKQDITDGVCYACWQTWEEMSSRERHAWHMGEVA